MTTAQNHPVEESVEFALTREIDAPRELVWKAHTEAASLEEWWGPKGLKTHVRKLELRPGGTFLYGMQTPDGQMMWGRWTFREVTAPERLAMLISFCDEEGNPVRHPMSPAWPLEILSTMTFTEKDGRTVLALRVVPWSASPEECATFAAGRESMKHGFSGTYDQLDEYLVRTVQE